MHRPTVTVLIPTYNEEAHLGRALDAVRAQTYPLVVEVLVADGRSSDRTREIAATYSGVAVVDNPRRIQAAGLNLGIAAAQGDVIVRVDGHCLIADDYVERCVEALETTNAAMVGGGMTPAPHDLRPVRRGIASAMASRIGAGPARFHVGGRAGWVDTVYLGAFRTEDARAAGGYAEDVGVNEDSEFAIRMNGRGGIWFDSRIRSTYEPRSSYRALGKQFFRYGRSRAQTALRHPSHVRARQLAAPLLVLGLLSPQRRLVASLYASILVTRGVRELGRDRPSAVPFTAALPVMHLCWGTGFLIGLVSPPHPPASRVDDTKPRPGERSTLDVEVKALGPGA